MPWYWKFFGWMVFYMLTIMSCMIIWVVSYIKERETAKKYGQQFDRESCFKFLEFRQDNQKTVQHQKEFNKETMFDIQNTILTPKVSKGDRNSKETRFKEQHEKSKGALDINDSSEFEGENVGGEIITDTFEIEEEIDDRAK